MRPAGTGKYFTMVARPGTASPAPTSRRDPDSGNLSHLMVARFLLRITVPLYGGATLVTEPTTPEAMYAFQYIIVRVCVRVLTRTICSSSSTLVFGAKISSLS